MFKRACVVLLLLTPAFSQVDPAALVRRAVDLEVRYAQDYSRPYRYTLRKDTNAGSALRKMVETQEGLLLARTITWNGKVPTAEEQAKEDRRLERLITDPEERKKKAQEQKADAQRVMRILRALPNSSVYTFEGRELLNGRDNLRLAFVPRKDFSPDAREAYLLKATAGKMWIDDRSGRLVRIDAAITDSVSIGWGILGRIDKGGKLFLEQSMVPGGEWRLTDLRIDATGKALLFKTIRIKQHQSGFDYEPIQPVSVQEAVAMLKRLATAGTSARR